MTINYFAFGSNLSSRRLLQRLPKAEVGEVAILDGHRLCWRKNDRGQSGKCDIEPTGADEDLVYGVIYHMTLAEQAVLDGYETEGFGYQRKPVTVKTLAGDTVEVFTYYALDIDEQQKPFHWYKEHVLRGALEHGFPLHYVEQIRATPSINDHDVERHERELSIYPDPE